MNQGLFNSDKANGAAEWVQRVVESADHPVVLFGVDWCGYCWSARDVLKQLGLDYRDIDVQNANDTENHDPIEVRRALLSLTGSHTVPQVFIGGRSLGGATELIAAVRNGQLSEMLAPLGISLDGIG